MYIKWMELHTPLFLAGTNLGMKLDVEKKDIIIIYDREHREVSVYFNQHLAILPLSNIAAMVPVEVGVIPPKPVVERKPLSKLSPCPTLPPTSSQVSTPSAHVLKGPGHGRRTDGNGEGL